MARVGIVVLASCLVGAACQNLCADQESDMISCVNGGTMGGTSVGDTCNFQNFGGTPSTECSALQAANMCDYYKLMSYCANSAGCSEWAAACTASSSSVANCDVDCS